ncbi:MAG: DNA-deoxyinosine glycosylase [Dokdonella sp.]
MSAASIISSFPPQVGVDCRVLVLGTMPGVRSLTAGQFYAHPRNLFWPFMGTLYGAAPELAYAARIAHLHHAGIGLWDVLEHCERKGSLDSDIRAGSVVPNDIPSLLDKHTTIDVIALNGKEASRIFAQRIAPRIGAARFARTTILALPSTSPANASIPRAIKLERWSELMRWSSRPSELGRTG